MSKDTRKTTSTRRKSKKYGKKFSSSSNQVFIDRLKQLFAEIPEGRRHECGRFRYHMADFMIAVIISLIRGCYQGDAIVQYWKENKALLHSFGLFTNIQAKGNVPSLATFYRMQPLLDPRKFCELFYKFIIDIATNDRVSGLKILSVDGKTMRGTSCGETNRPMHILTAFYNSLSIPVNVVNCAEKSNEITAWQTLLDSLKEFCRDKIFTSDAMGCQAKIVKKITDYDGHYCLALKGNQSSLEREVKMMIERRINNIEHYEEKVEKSHGRIQWRECTVYNADPEYKNRFLTDLEKWDNIKRIVHIKSHRIDPKTNIESTEDRFYISDLEESAENFNSIARAHWGVEILHYVLDVDFKQDCIKRNNDITGAASRNLDTFHKAAYVILKLYDILLSKMNKDRKRLGIKKLTNRANASNRLLYEIFNLEADWMQLA